MAVTLTGTQTVSGAKTFSGGVTFSTTSCTFSAAVALGGSATATTQPQATNTTAVATTAYVRSQPGIDATGTVTSVNITVPSIFTAGSAVTTSGSVSFTVASQTQNTVWAAPNGSAGAPAFRALVAADIPTLTASKISDFATVAQGYRLDQFAAPTASVSMNSQKITGLATPTAASDAATKDYVDQTALGLEFKNSVRAASPTGTNVNIASALVNGGTLDGVTLATGDRVLLKDQTTSSQNGIYVVVASGAASRATDFNSSTNITAGSFVYVDAGTTNVGTAWVMNTTGAITVGTTNLTFAQFAGGGSTGTGSTSIVTLGTIATGTWQAVAIGAAYGGTGLTSAPNGLIKGNGSTTYSAAVAGTDYLTPTNIGSAGSATFDGGTY
jgi:hypothetical protein